MNGECYFCNGIVSTQEAGDFLLDNHADHEVYLHEECAVGHDMIAERSGSHGAVLEISCPDCGTIETRGSEEPNRL